VQLSRNAQLPDLFHFRDGNFLTSSVIIVSSVSANRLRANTHLARDIFGALEGDVRVKDDTILVTYYNAPHQKRLREHYENLPAKLRQEGIEPTLPWLYGFQLDFRFR